MHEFVEDIWKKNQLNNKKINTSWPNINKQECKPHYKYLPSLLPEQDVTQGQFLSGV